jgi:hypothetical protein
MDRNKKPPERVAADSNYWGFRDLPISVAILRFAKLLELISKIPQ